MFAAVPPLHRVIVMNPGSKPNETIYTYSEAELNGVLAGLKRTNKRYQDPIQRYKGLGEMDADQLATTTMDRRHRTLRRVRLSDAEDATRVFELLMGNEVAPRKEFIIAGDGFDRTAHRRLTAGRVARDSALNRWSSSPRQRAYRDQPEARPAG